MKTILLSLLVLTGALAKAQSSSSQATQFITLRLQPVSFIDLSSAEPDKAAKQTATNEPAASTQHGIIVGKNRPEYAAMPPATQQDDLNPYKRAAASALNTSGLVYTFSSM